MGKANATPNEEESEARKGEKPVEDGTTLGRLANVGEEAESKLDEHTPERATLAVNVGQELRGVAALSHSLHGSGGTESARVGDGQDGDGDDSIEDGGKDLDTSILDGQDEWRGLCVGTGSTEKTLIIAAENDSDDEEVDNVEDCDTPEDLLGGGGNGLAGIRRLGSGETNHLSTTKSEGSDNEDGAETLEVGKSTRVVPVFDAEVTLVADTATVDDDTEDDETNTGKDLDDGENEFDFTVSSDTEDLDNDESDEKDGDPHSHVDVITPKRDCFRGSNQFERQDSEPRESVFPTTGETPGLIDEADNISVEGTVDGV